MTASCVAANVLIQWQGCDGTQAIPGVCKKILALMTLDDADDVQVRCLMFKFTFTSNCHTFMFHAGSLQLLWWY